MSSYNEDIQDLIKISNLLYREVKRLNTKIRNDRLTRIMNNIPPKTVLYSGHQLKNNNIMEKNIDTNNKIVINFNE